ncbi:MAG: M15 family metallopeptidase [Flavobacteriales bacterium]|nr:M15 family metallopeptidase [Flavobacteriales bacterium]
MKQFLLLICLLSIAFTPQEAAVNYSEDELMGTFDPKTHPDFELIPPHLSSKSNIYLRKASLKAFENMHREAKKDGIQLTIISATRNYTYQKGIWERKWAKSKYMGWQGMDKVEDIMKYSSMPGTSRHHWGTDIDLNSLDNSYFSQGEGKKVYDWLSECAADHCFKQVYTNKSSGRTGYEEEKWHWSYMPLSKEMLRQYKEKISAKDIPNFPGSEHIDSLKIIERYVNGVEEN